MSLPPGFQTGSECEREEDPSLALGASNRVSAVELPDQLPPAVPPPQEGGEERWLPLPGEVGKEIEALARAALGEIVPPLPEPDLDFNLLDDTDDTEAVGQESVLPDEVEPDEAVEPPPPEESTAAEAAAGLNLPRSGHMEVACPSCSTTGLVPWDRLDGVLCCSGCWTWFQIGADGRKTVVDPPAASQGALRLYSRNGPDRTVKLKPELLEEKRQAARRLRRWGRAGTLLSGLRIGPIVTVRLPIAVMAVLIFLGVRWWSKPRVVKLPVELDQRAQLLAESWLKHDTKLMVRLAHPNCRGITRRWAFDHPPPVSPGHFDRRRAAIDVCILRQDEDSAEVEVRVDLSGLSGSPEPTVWQQRWRSQDGFWFFHPANDPLPQAPKVAAAPRRVRK